MKLHLNSVAAFAGLLILLAESVPAADDTVHSSSPSASAAAPVKHNKANYELAARWTAQKTGKLVFDTSVSPHWMDTGDRFWYAYENNNGRRFYIVDPLKKAKSLVFDPPKLAALLTTATGLAHEGQHLEFRTIKFVKNEAAIQFEINVPRDAIIPGEKKTTVTTQATEPNQDSDDPQQRRAAALRP